MMTTESDGELLRDYVQEGSLGALEHLLRRHGPLVKGVCLRVLQSEQDAEDAAQETFLVFSRRAASIRKSECLANWLYGAALRCAGQLKRNLAVRHKYEAALERETVFSDSQEQWKEIRPILDEELGCLAVKYQEPLIHFYLEGKSEKETARELGVPHQTLRTRLARARDLLRERLIRRGVTISSAALGTMLLEYASPSAYAIDEFLVTTTIRAAVAPGVAGSSPFSLGALLLCKKTLLAAVTGVLVTGAAGWQWLSSASEPKLVSAPPAAIDPQLAAAVAPQPSADKSEAQEQRQAAADWQARLRKILALKSWQERRDTLEKFAAEVASADLDVAFSLIDKTGGAYNRDSFIRGLFAEWSRKQPERASEQAAIYPDFDDDRAAAIHGVAIGWSESDPPAAAAWLEKTPRDDRKSAAPFYSIATAWAMRDPLPALAWAKQTKAQLGLTQQILTKWAARDPLAAAAWAEKQVEDPVAAQIVAGTWAESLDPKAGLAAIEWARKLAFDEEMASRIIESAAGSWSRTHPDAAAAWVLTIPPSNKPDRGSGANGGFNSRDRIVSGMVRGLAHQGNPQTAKVLLNTLPRGEELGRALTGKPAKTKVHSGPDL